MKEAKQTEILDVRELLLKVYELHGSSLVLLKILQNGRLQLIAVASDSNSLETILTTKEQLKLGSYVG